jgi:hypothetical protein
VDTTEWFQIKRRLNNVIGSVHDIALSPAISLATPGQAKALARQIGLLDKAVQDLSAQTEPQLDDPSRTLTRLLAQK